MTSNIILPENKAFGNPNYEIVQMLLNMVDANMMDALALPRFSSQQCVVVHTPGDPMCCQSQGSHLIMLSTHDNFWCQWVYQFAHEYCHHLINGSLSGEWSDLLWFEETICQISSLYNLYFMESFCRDNNLNSYAPSVKQYFTDELYNNHEKCGLKSDGGWYEEYKTQLSEEPYIRDLYSEIATLMLPLFIENPNLWKIILNIGDIRSWESLEALLDHLESKADDTYIESFHRFRSAFC